MDYLSKTVMVPVNTSLSLPVDLGEDSYAVSIGLPTDWVAANLTFQGCPTGGATDTYYDIHNTDGTIFTVTTGGAGRFLAGTTLTEALKPFRYIKVRSGTAVAPVNQTGNSKTLTISIKQS